MTDAAESIDEGVSNEVVEPSGQQEAPPSVAETAAQARARIKLGDEELDDAAYVDRIREVLGEDALANIHGLAKVARTKVSAVGKQEHQLRRAVEDLRDPERMWDVIEHLHGPKMRTLMEERYARYLDEDRVSPEEREKRLTVSELQKLKAEKAALEQEKRERESTAMREQLIPQFGRDFTHALKSAGADADAEMLGAMAAYVEQELDTVRGEEDYRVLVNEAARAVARKYGDTVATRFPKLPKDRIMPGLREVLRGMTYEELRDALGDEGARKFRAGDIAAVKRGNAPAPAAASPRATSNGNGAREKVSLDDFFATIRNGDKL